MLKTYDMRTEGEKAEDALAELASGGYLPGRRVSRHLLLPVNYPFGPHEVVAKYGSMPSFCLKSTGIMFAHTPIPLHEMYYEEICLQWALVEVGGTIAEDAEPGVYKCNKIELHHWGLDPQTLSLDDLGDVVSNAVLDQARWPRDITVGDELECLRW
jgi:hypothetical protein